MSFLTQEPSRSAINPHIAVILGSQRSGTTALGTALAATRHVEYAGEIFHEIRGSHDLLNHEKFFNNPVTNFFTFKQKLVTEFPSLIYPSTKNQKTLWDMFVNYLLSRSDQKWVISIKYNSMHHLDQIWRSPLKWPELLYILSESNIPIIHLTRKDLFAQVISEYIANDSGTYHSRLDIKEGANSFSPDDIKQKMEELHWEYQHLQNLISFYNQRIELVYEDIFKDYSLTPEVCSQIKEFLNLTEAPRGSTPLRKLSRRPLSETISNREEIWQAFRGHMFQEMIDTHLSDLSYLTP